MLSYDYGKPEFPARWRSQIGVWERVVVLEFGNEWFAGVWKQVICCLFLPPNHHLLPLLLLLPRFHGLLDGLAQLIHALAQGVVGQGLALFVD